MPPKDLPSYVKWVIDQKPELKNTPEDVKVELQSQLEDRLDDLINAAIIENLPDSELDYFQHLLNNGTDQQIQDFCQQNIPDMDEVVAGVLIQFRNDYLGA